jgi:glyoxylase-like metal-dependent hydrolase (beta-lactamase superfamily II)
MKQTFFRRVLTCLVILSALAGSAFAQSDPDRAITHIAGDLYRFQNHNHFSVFLVTSDGIIATDPINADAATWLKSELTTRFPRKPVKYLIYSHSHADHISGGEVFADTATIVAHENAKVRIVSESVPTAIPQITFSERQSISLGGKSVELMYFGPGHSDNLIVMHFPQERALFVVDIVAPKRLPYRDLPNADIDGWIDTLRQIETLDFDILAPGHSVMGTPVDIADHRGYLEALRDSVQAGVDAGKSLDEIKRTVTLDAYRDWGSYDSWREMNIEGMYRYLSSK